MKWFSVKKHTPVLMCALTLVRVQKNDAKFFYFDLAEFDNGWRCWANKVIIEDGSYHVTHFCIPDPIPIED